MCLDYIGEISVLRINSKLNQLSQQNSWYDVKIKINEICNPITPSALGFCITEIIFIHPICSEKIFILNDNNNIPKEVLELLAKYKFWWNKKQ